MTTISLTMDCLTFQTVERKASNLRLTRPNMLLVSGLFLALIVQLIVRISIVQQGYSLESLRQQAVERDSQLRALSYELAAVTGANVIAKRAKDELGLAPMGPQQIRRINPELY